MNWRDHITIDSEVLAGKPILKGTRLAVDLILELLAAEWSEHDLLENYPGLTHEQVMACLAYARDLVRLETVAPLPG